jgi:hypothetical protein
MKKRNLVFAIAIAASFAACNSKTEESTTTPTDTIPSVSATTPPPVETQPTTGQQVDTALAKTKEAGADAKQEVKDAAAATKEGIKDAAHNVKEGTKEAAHDVKNAAKNGAKKVEKAAKDVKEDLKK